MRRLSVWERLPLIGRLGSETRDRYRSIQTEVEQAAATLKISPLLDRKPGQMSGGQRQRVALGRALVRHPKTFLMDEPLSNLDAALRVHTRAEIVELHKRAGVVTLYVTHDQEEALSMADRVAVMIGGRIMQCDIAGLEWPDQGQIMIGGKDVTQTDPAKRGIAMVFQSYALFPHLNVADNITFGLKVRGVGRGERDQRLKRVADLVGLTPYCQGQ